MGSRAETCGHVPVCGNFSVSEPKAPTWRRYLTVQNGLLATVALFQLGTLWERQQGTNSGLTTALANVRSEVAQLRSDLRQETETTYARKDVITIQLSSIEGRLEVIETMVREELRPVSSIRRFDR